MAQGAPRRREKATDVIRSKQASAKAPDKVGTPVAQPEQKPEPEPSPPRTSRTDSRRRRGPRRRPQRRPQIERVMLVHADERGTQIAVLEKDEIVEHYTARHEDRSIVGNVYMGRVQNVLPGMEASFVDIGESRNGVL